MHLQHDDVVIVRDIHGEPERMRALWKAGEHHWWFKSLDHPHAKKRKIALSKIESNQGQRK